MAVQISPSILSADFARLAEAAAAVSNADWLHVDVMDNHFVPNLTLGLPVVESLLKASSLPVDCHLMIEDPDRWAPAYAEAGAGSVTFHVEAAAAPVRLARALRRPVVGLDLRAVGVDRPHVARPPAPGQPVLHRAAEQLGGRPVCAQDPALEVGEQHALAEVVEHSALAPLERVGGLEQEGE